MSAHDADERPDESSGHDADQRGAGALPCGYVVIGHHRGEVHREMRLPAAVLSNPAEVDEIFDWADRHVAQQPARPPRRVFDIPAGQRARRTSRAARTGACAEAGARHRLTEVGAALHHG